MLRASRASVGCLIVVVAAGCRSPLAIGGAHAGGERGLASIASQTGGGPSGAKRGDRPVGPYEPLTQQQALAEVAPALQELALADPEAHRVALEQMARSEPSLWPLVIERAQSTAAYKQELIAQNRAPDSGPARLPSAAPPMLAAGASADGVRVATSTSDAGPLGATTTPYPPQETAPAARPQGLPTLDSLPPSDLPSGWQTTTPLPSSTDGAAIAPASSTSAYPDTATRADVAMQAGAARPDAVPSPAAQATSSQTTIAQSVAAQQAAAQALALQVAAMPSGGMRGVGLPLSGVQQPVQLQPGLSPAASALAIPALAQQFAGASPPMPPSMNGPQTGTPQPHQVQNQFYASDTRSMQANDLADGERGSIRLVSAMSSDAASTAATPSEQASITTPGGVMGWRAQLDGAIAALEASLSGSPRGDQDSYQFARLRLLQLAAGRSEGAVAAIPGLPPAEQGYWSDELFALATMMDTERRPERTLRASAAAHHQRSAATRLAQLDGLKVRNLTFCEKVYGYGAYEPAAETTFRAGQRVTLYAEVDHYRSDATDQGYRTELATRYRIVGPGGDEVDRGAFPVVEDLCLSPRRDFHIQYGVELPATLAAGRHRMELVIQDKLAGKTVEDMIVFDVTP